MSIVIIKTVVDTGWYNGDYVDHHYVDKEEWESITEGGRKEMLFDYARKLYTIIVNLVRM